MPSKIKASIPIEEDDDLKQNNRESKVKKRRNCLRYFNDNFIWDSEQISEMCLQFRGFEEEWNMHNKKS